MHRRTATRIAVAVLTAAALGATSTTAAHATQTAKGDVTSGPFHVVFDAQRADGTRSPEATGTFQATTTIGGRTVMDIEGPVTCLDVRGNSAGLFYPITRSTPGVLAMTNSGVLLTLTVDGRGNAQSVSFLPLPFASVPGCRPVPTVAPASGKATVGS